MASRLRRRGVVLPAAALLVVGGGAVAYASSGSSGPGYRTATVSTGDVEQRLTETGTSSYTRQATPHFRTAGTVATVKVGVGDTVQAGQVLATLDPTPLQDAVVSATAALAQAKATLETDQTSATPSPTATPSRTSPTRTSSTRGGVAAAQRASDAALKAASDALRTAVAVCHATTGPTPDPTATPTATSSATPSAAPTGPTCEQALQGALALQQRAARAQQDLSRALQSAAATTTTPTTTTPTTAAAPAASTQGIQRWSSTTSSAARVTTDQAAVVAAQTALDSAQADLAGASLTSPIAGTVAALPYTAGATETVGSHATVLGPGAVTVTVDVPLASIRSVRVGQSATVLADGSTTPVPGAVTAIALLPATSTSGTVSYPVTVLVPRPGGAFVDGSAASVSLLVKRVQGVVTVPNSALANGFVTVLTKGTAVRTRVTTGAVGALLTEVTSGVTVGQQVVLADLSQALPTSSTTNTRRFGGGFGPAGFGGPTGVTVRRG